MFRQKYNCAQATLAALGPAEGLERDTCLKIASTFGGGTVSYTHLTLPTIYSV